MQTKRNEDSQGQDEKLQDSEHEVINQLLQDYSCFLRKEICVNPYKESNIKGLEGSETDQGDIAIFSKN